MIKKPKTLKNNCFLDAKEKEATQNFLLNWATYYDLEGNLIQWATVIKEILGYEQQEFNDNLEEYKRKLNVSEFLNTQNRYGKRPLTFKEIVFNFDGNLNERTVLKQIERLKKWNEIKETKLKVNGHIVKFYKSI